MTFGDERIPKRIWDKIQVDADGHWIWSGAFSSVPQTRVSSNGVARTISVRRWLYETVHGAHGVEAVGGCLKRCVNPDHVSAGSSVDIVRAWWLKHPTLYCIHGHDLRVVGTYKYGSDRTGACRACISAQNVRRVARRRARRIAHMAPATRSLFIQRSMRQRQYWASFREKRRTTRRNKQGS